jgi:GntR family transcriptional regulator, carbon starvation induced regulator
MAEAVYRRFRQDIVWGKLPPDTPLRSDELRQTYGIGISPLREALSRLVSEQLVTSLGQRGFRVAPLTMDDVTDVLETRLVIEAEALARSIRSSELMWERDVVSSFHVLSRIPLPKGPGEQAETWAMHHRSFHMALLSGCNSRWMVSLAGALFDQAERHRLVVFRAPESVSKRDPAAEHRQIMEAALAGNVKAAIAALGYHYRTTADQVLRELTNRKDNQVVPKLLVPGRGRRGAR